jgi:hypothetical protein
MPFDGLNSSPLGGFFVSFFVGEKYGSRYRPGTKQKYASRTFEGDWHSFVENELCRYWRNHYTVDTAPLYLAELPPRSAAHRAHGEAAENSHHIGGEVAGIHIPRQVAFRLGAREAPGERLPVFGAAAGELAAHDLVLGAAGKRAVHDKAAAGVARIGQELGGLPEQALDHLPRRWRRKRLGHIGRGPRRVALTAPPALAGGPPMATGGKWAQRAPHIGVRPGYASDHPTWVALPPAIFSQVPVGT